MGACGLLKLDREDVAGGAEFGVGLGFELNPDGARRLLRAAGERELAGAGDGYLGRIVHSIPRKAALGVAYDQVRGALHEGCAGPQAHAGGLWYVGAGDRRDRL